MHRRLTKITAGIAIVALALSTARVVYAWHGNVDPEADCDGWSLNISASPSEGAHWSASPGESGDWSAGDTVNWEVDFTWENSSETDHKQGTLNKPQECEEPTPTPTPTPTPEVTPTPTPTPGPQPTSTPTPGHECPDSKPTAAPNLSGFRSSATSVVLTWNSVGPVSHYMIRYGTSPGSYEHSVLDVGNTNIYEVKDLLPNVKYYFQVAGVNGCQPGDWSNEITPREAAKVLGAVTHEPVAAGSGDVDFSVVATATAAAGSLFLLLARVTRRNYILDL